MVLGSIVTNLGDDERRLTSRHVALYRRRARAGTGLIVVEDASVHPSDWPYERAPLADRCGEGWAAISDACREEGALVVAGLGHTGGQGSSAYSQRELWAPSRVPEVNSREVPKWMEAEDIAAVVAGFSAAATLAVTSGCDGVEVNAGQHSLVRQFLSGLTNQRDDEWGHDRRRFATDVLRAVRASVGSDHLVGLRLSCDELAPWAGITPEMAPGIAASLADHVDYVVVTRGAIFSVEQTRPDFHEPTGFNAELSRAVRAALPPRVAVVLQGSVVDPGQAEWAVTDGVCDAVEMTRAQLADPDLVAKLVDGTPERIRPCLRCNQTCQVRDARNPIITCVVEPTTGHELDDPDWYRPAAHGRDVLVIGGGPAGLETARVAASRGHRVRLIEQSDRLGGAAAIAGPGLPYVEWAAGEIERLGVRVTLGRRIQPDADAPSVAEGSDAPRAAQPGSGAVVVQCSGSRRGAPTCPVEGDVTVPDVLDVRSGAVTLPPEGDVVLLDPIGGPIAVALAEELGERAVLVTQDSIAGNELARSGDLAPANVRLQRRGVRIVRRAVPRLVRSGSDGSIEVEVADRYTNVRTVLHASAVVDCGFRLPQPPLAASHLAAGDCVAPRTLLEAVLEGRRAALAIDHI